jgi:high-affinity Fe2+/Pb2+ permease
MLAAPFLLGLAYAANFAKKDLTFAKVAFRNTAIAQMGLFLVALYGYLTAPSVLILILAAIALILGGLACLVIYQASKQ